jgi:hypothetical protein
MAEILKQSNLNKARLDKFILAFSIPKCLRTSTTRAERSTHHKSWMKVIPDDIQYSVYGVVVPEISVPSVSLPQFGQHMKVSSHRRDEYADISVDFNVDNEFNNYWYIYRWLDILNDQYTAIYDNHEVGTSTGIPYHADGSAPTRSRLTDPNVVADYATDMALYGLNEYNKKVIEFTYKAAFPVSLGDISFNHQSPDEIKSSFTFSFSQLNVALL